MRKSLRNIDSVARSQVIRSFCWLFPFLGLLGFFLWGFSGVLIAAALSLPLSLVVVYAAGRFGVFAGSLYGGRRPDWKESEFYEADIDRIRHLKVKKNYASALRGVNRLLAQSPKLPQALYLKAQILHEGFGNTDAARHSLEKIIAMGKDCDKSIYRWARSLKEEIETGEPEPPAHESHLQP